MRNEIGKGFVIKILLFLFLFIELNFTLYANDISMSYEELLYSTQKTIQKSIDEFGEKDIRTANTYYNIGQLFYSVPDFKKALMYNQKALDILLLTNGNYYKKSRTYSGMGLIYHAMGDYDKAISLFNKSLKELKKVEQKDTIDIAFIYSCFGVTLEEQGKTDKALNFFKKSLPIYQKLLGNNHQNVATAYNNIGAIYKDRGEFKQSLIFFNKALKIQELQTTPDYGAIIGLYINLGSLVAQEGNFDLSLKYFNKALHLSKNNLSEKHPLKNLIYNNMGITFMNKGNYGKALEFLYIALERDLFFFKTNHSNIAIDYNNIAKVYNLQGDLDKSLEFYNKALVILLNSFGENHPYISTIYTGMGMTFSEKGNYDKALEYYKKVVKINDKTLKKAHPKKAIIFGAIAHILRIQNKYEEALEYNNKALNINLKFLGENHQETANIYNQIAIVYHVQNQYKKALKYYKKVLKIDSVIYDENHPNRGASNTSIALIYIKLNETTKAYTHIKKAFDIFMRNRKNNFLYLDSKTKEKYLKAHYNIPFISTFYFISLQYITQLQQEKNFIGAKRVSEKLLNGWIEHKGTIFDSENILTMVYTKTSDSRVKQNITKLRELTIRLSQLYSKNINQKQINFTEQEISNTQKILSKQDNTFKKILNLEQITLPDILDSLSKNQLFIAISKGDYNYYIFTIDKFGHPLFRGMSIDNKQLEYNIKKFRENNQKIVNAIEEKRLTTELENKLNSKNKIILSTLYNIVIKPLTPLLKNKQELIISPDGLLNFLPFEALYHDGKYLIEDYKISYISSGREFVRQTRREPYVLANRKMICFGSPDFNASIPISQTKGKFGGVNQKVEETWEQFKNFDPIRNEEIVTIRNLYKDALIYEGKEANVKNLMSIGSSQILHFSTHGKFLNNESIKNPMLKAGLAFSGANKDTANIVTALKISALDLHNTELVVLSACESGLGEVQNAEGVMGLPKAFLQAGARNVMMSLWSVSSQQTATLMKNFYKNVQNGQDYETALRKAKLEMIKIHPYYWSAFIMHGIQN